MRQSLLSALLPALVPSWRFFDDVGPSPRLEVAVLHYASDSPLQWAAFPAASLRVTAGAMLQHLFWNPQRNEALFLLSCCERLLERDSLVAREHIVARIRDALQKGTLQLPSWAAARCFVFRIRLVSGEDDELRWHDAYLSSPQPYQQAFPLRMSPPSSLPPPSLQPASPPSRVAGQ